MYSLVSLIKWSCGYENAVGKASDGSNSFGCSLFLTCTCTHKQLQPSPANPSALSSSLYQEAAWSESAFVLCSRWRLMKHMCSQKCWFHPAWLGAAGQPSFSLQHVWGVDLLVVTVTDAQLLPWYHAVNLQCLALLGNYLLLDKSSHFHVQPSSLSSSCMQESHLYPCSDSIWRSPESGGSPCDFQELCVLSFLG